MDLVIIFFVMKIVIFSVAAVSTLKEENHKCVISLCHHNNTGTWWTYGDGTANSDRLICFYGVLRSSYLSVVIVHVTVSKQDGNLDLCMQSTCDKQIVQSEAT